jgi:hypothetical protein
LFVSQQLEYNHIFGNNFLFLLSSSSFKRETNFFLHYKKKMDTIMNYVDSTFFRSKKEERPILPMITAATVLLFTVYKLHTGYQKYEKKMKRDLKEIPVPDSAWPYFGHMLSLGKVPSKKIVEWHGKLGPIIQLHMGVHRWVSVDDPALAHKIFVTHGVDTSYRPHSAFAYHHYSLEGK